MKELYIVAHEELIEEAMGADPCLDERKAYDMTADKAYDRLIDKLADIGDYERLRRRGM